MTTFQSFRGGHQRAEDPFDAKIRKSLNGEKQTTYTDAADFLENAPLEDLRLAANKLARSDADKVAAEQSKLDGDAFTKAHPEWLDTPENSYQLLAHCIAAFGTEHPNFEQMESAFQALRATNLITLNQRALDKQAHSAAQARANTIRERQNISEAEMEALPLEVLKRRALGIWE